MARAAPTDPYSRQDPLPSTVRDGDHVLLHFADHRQIFAHALPRWKNANGYSSCKIQKRTYATHTLIGLRYGTVLEVGRDTLLPLPEGADLLPDAPEMGGAPSSDGAATPGPEDASATGQDNRDLVDDNTSQKLTAAHVQTLLSTTSTPGAHIVAALISNSSTFGSKTAFSQAKYVKRKQLKYQPRCRVVRVTPATLCAALHLKDAKRISNLREDTLGQILSHANVSAGQRVLVMDTAVQGIVAGSCVRRMGGYGTVLGLFAGQQPSYLDVVGRLNLGACERQCLKWVPLAEAFGDRDGRARQTDALREAATGAVRDVERRDREKIAWPAPLQPHTREYLAGQANTQRKTREFMKKRSARFARKLTRHSGLELRALMDGCCDFEESVDTRAGKNEDQETGEGKEQTKTKNGEMGTTRMDTTDTTAGNATDESQSEINNETRQCDSLMIAKTEKVKEQSSTKNGATETTIIDISETTAGNATEDAQNHHNDTTRQCDSLIIATKYDPTATLLTLLPYLAPSCPFVIYHEFLEPLLDTFRALHPSHATTPMMLRRNTAINLRLTDTWFREYQVLDGRTHPNMTMSQNGGYLLMGTKLCPKTGTNELTEEMMKEIRAKVGGRRKQQRGNKGDVGALRKKKKRKTEKDEEEQE